jgi:cyclopropane fatty-acyl-phospholipid synthase-like methyltransferase
LDAIGIKPGQRCLDLGSGAGTSARGLAERTGPTGQVVAVDLLMRNLYRQLAPAFLANDVFTEAELIRLDELMLDPRFSAWFYAAVTPRGRRPAG